MRDYLYLGTQEISEAYHKAKADGSNPELVKAVEKLLNDKGTTTEASQPVQQDTPTGKELAADALDRIASKLGGKKNLTEERLRNWAIWLGKRSHLRLVKRYTLIFR